MKKRRYVEIQITCHDCGVKDAIAFVRERNPEVDVIQWMENEVKPTIQYKHFQLSPKCHSQHCDLKIHLPADAEFVGQAPKPH